ncbi:MAG: DUF1822 family protein [Cyanobacteriota bacterium]|nr:DUF1822 family protein [Cyanobacteriota bacterium]
MKLDLNQLANIHPKDIWLDLSVEEINRAWEESRNYSNDAARWNAYLNLLSLNPLVEWLRTETENSPQVWPSSEELPYIWDAVPGSAININKVRFVIIPTEQIDAAELRVPQEWIDIPSWAGDYYLAVQVNPDGAWLRLWGIATYQQLKNRGEFDQFDRSYSLERKDLTLSFNAVWVKQQISPPEKPKVAALLSLSWEEVEELLGVLGEKNKLYSPRLEVPFAKWGALMENPHLRRLLFQRREGIRNASRSPLPERPIFDWFKDGISEAAKQVGWELRNWQSGTVLAKGIKEETSANGYLSRELFIAGQYYELRVTPRGLESGEIAWRFELKNLAPGGLIPGGFKLRLLTETGEDFDKNEVVAEFPREEIYNDIVLEEGEGLIWETVPYPEGFQREVLRF